MNGDTNNKNNQTTQINNTTNTTTEVINATLADNSEDTSTQSSSSDESEPEYGSDDYVDKWDESQKTDTDSVSYSSKRNPVYGLASDMLKQIFKERTLYLHPYLEYQNNYSMFNSNVLFDLKELGYDFHKASVGPGYFQANTDKLCSFRQNRANWQRNLYVAGYN